MAGLALAMIIAAGSVADPGQGISAALAHQRSASIRDLRYELAFSIPRDRRTPVEGRLVARFVLERPQPVIFDFAHSRERIRAISTGGKPIDPAFTPDHVIVPAPATRAGLNVVEFAFTAGDEALNRGDDFLYTLFVPARAHFAFPCFDQPDLKARFALTLVIPDGWQVVANGAETLQREMVRGSEPGAWNDTVPFAETPPLPTYLFAFAAGRFSVETANRNGRQFRMFHRETDSARVARNRDALFDLHATAIAWLEQYTGTAYPFGKFDFVLIPSFQFSGMEHAGAILYNSASMLLDPSATQNQLLDRATTIAHETAHMWFGDLVTMRWFDDVWMKEVFANFMAAKIVNPSFPGVNHDLRFLLANYPAAYQIDRTAGANPIRQRLDNLDEAGQLYGPIIYQKAPIVMRQLELTIGPDSFRDGVREYLKAFAFGNASWNDLIRILDRRTPVDLARWSHVWVEERGRPTIASQIRLNADDTIGEIRLTQSDPLGRRVAWSQRLRIIAGYADRVQELDVDAARSTVTVPGAAGLPKPLYVLPNGGGLGYGLFLIDAASRNYLLAHIEDIADALTRGSAWITLWDNMLEDRIAPEALFDAAQRALPREADEQNAQRLLSYITRLFWRWLPQEQRASRAASLEAILRGGLDRAATSSAKAAWFNALRDTALTSDSLAWLTRVWRRDERIQGLPLAEPDEITLALELAVRDTTDANEILEQQLARTENPDRKARMTFVMPALSRDPAVREQAFSRLRSVENRRREPWVIESLQYLNHPLREAHARQFVRPALALLQEVRDTGDIFFPTRWIDATLTGHRSRDAATIVEQFLAEHPDYPQRLRWTVLSAADELFRMTK